ncbi:MAG TPA: LLM class flavin-dependent oxidoreductase [Beijerinckiaceae bacterium]|nr:LLM class flavin-dependent oxidoreductase [Beijerinckiaceae bacterium]
MDDAAAITDRGSMRGRAEMYNRNALKIGFFGANCSSARTATLVPERWSASWPDCLALAQLADEAGVDFLLPIGRWKGYGGDSDFHGTTLETLTWASGLLAATKRITVFGTVHAPLFHPLIAAKEMVTADHIGGGRFGLNLVAGWNEGEFAMFGVAQRDHEDRYDYAEEWLQVIKRAWSAEEFDFDGRYFKLAGVRAKPGPVGGTRPLIMNAGQSASGQAFAMRNCDAFFTSTSGARLAAAGTAQAVDEAKIFERIVKQVADIKADGRKHGRDIEVYTQGQVICRPTQQEAEEYHHYANVENADWSAIDQMLALKNITPRNTDADVFAAKRKLMAASGIGGYPFVGTPDRVAAEFANLGRAGFRGLAVSFVNYLKDGPYFCAEVLPRLARMGFRAG